MSASLVGSEMCIRDSQRGQLRREPVLRAEAPSVEGREDAAAGLRGLARHCLLYTSDAADDM
eukprot:193525-Alexandrium_andersonii.AAC.1